METVFPVIALPYPPTGGRVLGSNWGTERQTGTETKDGKDGGVHTNTHTVGKYLLLLCHVLVQ